MAKFDSGCSIMDGAAFWQSLLELIKDGKGRNELVYKSYNGIVAVEVSDDDELKSRAFKERKDINLSADNKESIKKKRIALFKALNVFNGNMFPKIIAEFELPEQYHSRTDGFRVQVMLPNSKAIGIMYRYSTHDDSAGNLLLE